MSSLRRLSLAVLSLALALSGTAASRAEEAAAPDVVRVPQVLAADALKVAVVGSAASMVGSPFTVIDHTGTVVYASSLEEVSGTSAPWAHAAAADFSTVDDPGTYRVVAGGIESGPVVVETDPYPGILASLLGIFDSNADGRNPSTLHGPSHLNDAKSKMANGPLKGKTIDVQGGWMDAGDQVKFTVTIGFAATMLQLAARNQPASAGRLNAMANVGTRWLLKAHPSKKIFVHTVGNVVADHDIGGFRDPADDDSSSSSVIKRRPTYVLTSGTKGADVAASASTALALAAQRTTGDLRKRYLRAAEEWFAKARSLRGPWVNEWYPQETVEDDLAAAAVELWRATGNNAYAEAALSWLRSVTDDGEMGWLVAMDNFEMAGLPAAELCGVLGRPGASNATTRNHACRILRAGADSIIYESERNAFGLAGELTWGSARGNQSGSLMALLASLNGYQPAGPVAHRALSWFLGANPWGLRFQVGYGVHHPHHWATVLGPDLPKGAIVGGPAPAEDLRGQEFLPPLTLGPFDTEEAVYRDHVDDYVTNEVSINYQAGSVLLMALLSPS